MVELELKEVFANWTHADWEPLLKRHDIKHLFGEPNIDLKLFVGSLKSKGIHGWFWARIVKIVNKALKP